MTLFFRFYLLLTAVSVVGAFLYQVVSLVLMAVVLVLGLVLMLMPRAFIFGVFIALGYVWYSFGN